MWSPGNRTVVRLLAVTVAGLVAASLSVVASAHSGPDPDPGAGPPGRSASGSAAPELPSGFTLRSLPAGQAPGKLTDFAHLPDGGVLTSGKEGTVAWVSADGARSRTLRDLPVVGVQDMGLLGLAAAVDYGTTRHVYLARSVPTGDGSFDLTLARWRVTGADEPTGLTDETELLRIPGDAVVHGITGIVPDPDGTLWVSVGDVADYTEVDPQALRAQDPSVVQGKILHLDADGRGVPDNPFYDPAAPDSARSKVFAGGFRSPFRLSLDPRTGLPLVGDVGWNTWEEINLVRPGRTYGWPCWEGTARTPGYRELPGCADADNTGPLVSLRHGEGADNANSVTGGVVYTGTSYPERYRGAYFFGDYAHGKLWTLRYDDQGRLSRAPESPPLGTDVGRPVSFGTAANGDIVYADIGSGTLKRLTYVGGNRAPSAHADVDTDPESRTVTFDASGSTDHDSDLLTYGWEFGDGETASGVRARHTYAEGIDSATATLTVTDPAGAVDRTEITVAPGNHTPRIEADVREDETYAVGDPVRVSARATDAEDGRLPLHWEATVVHCPEDATCHAHPTGSGNGRSFSIPFTDHPDSHMELTATATDEAGVSTTYTYVAEPREHRLTLTGNVPAALEIASEGDGDDAGGTTSSAWVTEGATVSVAAARTATDGESTFHHWEEDGATDRVRTFTMPADDLTLTAHYLAPGEEPPELSTDTASAADGPLDALIGPDGLPAELLDVLAEHAVPSESGRKAAGRR
ncbi:PQQ-dependent sugar dehydrogenase, partial [Saccharomonospora halophila]|uniref:PQQ-dependent sugar dehydrogenase n=1 Tax=Saccharomonospora halophila TaxID=129922 RepID=UPI0003701D60